MADSATELFENIGSKDLLGFNFGNKNYTSDLKAAVETTKRTCAITVWDDSGKRIPGHRCVYVEHDFSFFGGSLGCAEGQKITLAFKYAAENNLPIIIYCVSGGARMQEGTLSLMQMGKVSCAVASYKRKCKKPFITLLADPCFGGVSASYALQSDIKIGISLARLGFSGPAVILNTQFAMDQEKYDTNCPSRFQSMENALQNGQVDIITESLEAACTRLSSIFRILDTNANVGTAARATAPSPTPEVSAEEKDLSGKNYLDARKLTRFDADDIIKNVFEDFIELGGDGKVGLDDCLHGGVATFKLNEAGEAISCVVLKCGKGHTPGERKAHNYSMPSPAGYRTALRLFDFAERFKLPLVSFVDVVGAWCSFEAETAGQSEALATNLVKMADLKVPLIALLVSEGGSGGALAAGAVADKIGMMENAYYGVITPEGAASILGRYKNEEEKKRQFPLDCAALAKTQQIYPEQLQKRKVIDEVIAEDPEETYSSFPKTAENIREFLRRSLETLETSFKDADAMAELIEARRAKFEAMGEWMEGETREGCMKQILGEDHAMFTGQAKEKESFKPASRSSANKPVTDKSKIPRHLYHIAEATINGENSIYKSRVGKSHFLTEGGKIVMDHVPVKYEAAGGEKPVNAKYMLDNHGPEAMATWVRQQKHILLTDTTMRDAHQSLLATRVRTVDMLNVASATSELLHNCFSLECWGGATFDVAYRFLHEDPWARLRQLRQRIPNICFQMLLRGANAVGYKSYSDNVVRKFVQLAAKNGMDVFRIFDCFNDIEQMKISIDEVRKCNKVAEVCVCFTGDFLKESEKLYTLDYYKKRAQEIKDAGAHQLAIKDMAGLLKPGHAAPLIAALREVLTEGGKIEGIPIHFHTHNTSSAQLATLHAMHAAGCDIVDACMAAVADTTSQPSFNAFVATVPDTGFEYKKLEPLDNYWLRLRANYFIFESGMLSGSASVYDHQIPGGQYSNLYMQCRSVGLMDRWEEVLEMYRAMNDFCGDIVKVTPSSKVVGDMALLCIRSGVKLEDVKSCNLSAMRSIAWPQSAVEMAQGYLGGPHHGFSKEYLELVLHSAGLERLKERPGLSIPPADFEEEKIQLAKEFADFYHTAENVTDEDAVSAVLYPKVFRDYLERLWKYNNFTAKQLGEATGLAELNEGKIIKCSETPVGSAPLPFDSTMNLPTIPFTYGMEVGGKVTNNHAAGEETLAMTRITGLQNDGVTRQVSFVHTTPPPAEGSASTTTYVLNIVDSSTLEKKYEGPMADLSKPNQHVASPLGGQVFKIIAKAGDVVKLDDPLLVLSAMKLEVTIRCPCEEATVQEICVKKDQDVVENALLVRLKPAA